MFSPDEYEASYEDNAAVITEKATGTETWFTRTGTLEDLSVLEGMDNLTELVIGRALMTSPVGAEKLPALESIRFISCPRLENIAPVYENPEVRAIAIDHCTDFSTLDGIGKLKKLCALEIYQPSDNLRNLDALSEIDFSFVNSTEEGFLFGFEGERIQYFTSLSGLRLISTLRITDHNSSKWRFSLQNVRILQIEITNIHNQQLFETMLNDHAELEALTLNGCEKLRDLSTLAEMPRLKKVTVSKDGRALISTLDGREYDFTIEVK